MPEIFRKIEVKFDPGIRGVSKAWVKKVVSGVLNLEKAHRRFVSVLLVGDRKIQALNKKYLNHDRVTDVIAFWSKEDLLVGTEADYLGDLVVSVERARRVSQTLDIAFKEELARYLVHGTLHLLGYSDRNSRDRNRMHRRQEIILKRLIKNVG